MSESTTRGYWLRMAPSSSVLVRRHGVAYDADRPPRLTGLNVGSAGSWSRGPALTSDYDVILMLRLIMLAIGAVYTPQAATTVALIVPDQDQPSAIAFVFLGWSLAIAGGLPSPLPLTHFSWQTVYSALAVVAVVTAAMLFSAAKGAAGTTALTA